MGAASIIGFLDPVTYVGSRRAASTVNGSTGYVVPGSASALSIVGLVAPASGEDLLLLPEGLRSKKVLTLYTESTLRTVGGQLPADLVTVGDGDFQVHQYGNWPHVIEAAGSAYLLVRQN